MARRRIIAGNWKMNKTPSEAVALKQALRREPSIFVPGNPVTNLTYV